MNNEEAIKEALSRAKADVSGESAADKKADDKAHKISSGKETADAMTSKTESEKIKDSIETADLEKTTDEAFESDMDGDKDQPDKTEADLADEMPSDKTAADCAEKTSSANEANNKNTSKSRKKDKNLDKIKKLEEEAEALKDKNMRLMAEFDNFRKRTDKEKSHMYTIGAKEVIEKILPVLDSFERGLKDMDPDSEDPFENGMSMVYKQLLTALKEQGVEPIESDGAEFDPAYHNAVMHVDDPELEENVIVETFQKGYMYKNEVVRYAMVKVAN